MEILANLLREPGCGGGLIAGDFNAISLEDHALLDKNGLVDALDKVAMSGVDAKDMEILHPAGEYSNYIPCSDHFGLRLSFT
ncbi:hypothetical protein BDR07DRAFT_1395431, partial [Suillus spraguei]